MHDSVTHVLHQNSVHHHLHRLQNLRPHRTLPDPHGVPQRLPHRVPRGEVQHIHAPIPAQAHPHRQLLLQLHLLRQVQSRHVLQVTLLGSLRP